MRTGPAAAPTLPGQAQRCTDPAACNSRPAGPIVACHHLRLRRLRHAHQPLPHQLRYALHVPPAVLAGHAGPGSAAPRRRLPWGSAAAGATPWLARSRPHALGGAGAGELRYGGRSAAQQPEADGGGGPAGQAARHAGQIGMPGPPCTQGASAAIRIALVQKTLMGGVTSAQSR